MTITDKLMNWPTAHEAMAHSRTHANGRASHHTSSDIAVKPMFENADFGWHTTGNQWQILRIETAPAPRLFIAYQMLTAMSQALLDWSTESLWPSEVDDGISHLTPVPPAEIPEVEHRFVATTTSVVTFPTVYIVEDEDEPQ